MDARLIFKDCITVADCEKKLNALIESWPVVYIKEDSSRCSIIMRTKTPQDTHKARLAFIEEIVKEPCKHEPADGAFFIKHKSDGDNFISIEKDTFKNFLLNEFKKCKHCGVELKATWAAK